ncbi:MAG: SIMPL domain-containing protein [Bdellovibrionales bacterium]|nr:SIMPL domain-containing protein [Bdellovibrionales bacterium]
MTRRMYGGFLATVFFASGAVAFSAEPPRSVSVSGSCVRNVVPDRGSVTVVVDVKDPDAKRAQVAATRQYEALRSKVNALKLSDGEISTSEYVSEEIREWEKNRMVSRGYHTRIGLRVETSDHGRLGEVIDAASREGIKDVGELRNFVSTKKMLEEKMACLKEASEQARAKADALAKALGAKVGDVLTVAEAGTSDAPPPQPRFGAAMMAADATMKAAPTIEPGKTELSTNVQVTFMLR